MYFSINRYRRADSRLLRRDFLKLGLVVTGAVLNPVSALAAFDSKADAFKNLAFYNTHTNERLHVCYCRSGKYDNKALSKINHILRDHRNGEVKAIDTQLLDLLHAVSLKTNPREPFHVISGYRSPATNKKLRKKSTGVASRSLHMQGKAIDIRISGFRTRQLRNVARKLKVGGVGYYPKSDFVHVDIGRVRYW
ncbi:FIG001587: exported protein [Olavius sp. associated proteobacterium Delta 1]|nr:FIG001587: exported protein [Olavius sp. associated proteobacterium Delta 1]